MATCAMCQSAIIQPQRFVICGTEAVHTACARQGRQTILVQTQQALARALETAAINARRATELELKVADLERRATEHTERMVEEMAARRRLRQHATMLESELDRVSRDLDAARAREDLARRTPAQVVPPAAAPRDPPSPTPGRDEDNLDDCEKRMALLELDPL